MTNTISFPNMPEVEEQASLWLAALDRGLSKKENQQLEQWIDDHPTHAETLVKFAAMWDEMDVLAPISCIMPLEVQHINTEAEQQTEQPNKLEPKNLEPKKLGPKKRPERTIVNWANTGWAMAASVLLAVVMVNFYTNNNSIENQSLFYATYQTEIGENSDVTLPDGSVLQLNTNTQLTVSYTEGERRVFLHQGEAHFDVAKNKEYPFKAIVGSSTVTAVGTAFNIQLNKQQQVEVTVTEGKVLVDKVQKERDSQLLPTIFDNEDKQVQQHDGVLLGVGEMTQIGIEGDNTRTLDEEDLATSLAWQQGMIIFQGETLTEVIKEVSRYTAVKFEIVDQEIASTSVGGYFKTGDVDQLLLALEQNFNIPHKRKGNRVKLGIARK